MRLKDAIPYLTKPDYLVMDDLRPITAADVLDNGYRVWKDADDYWFMTEDEDVQIYQRVPDDKAKAAINYIMEHEESIQQAFHNGDSEMLIWYINRVKAMLK